MTELKETMKCRHCNSIISIWNGWELCDNCGYRYNIKNKNSPDDCTRCKGAGVLSDQGADVCCPSCGGTGLKR